LNTVVLVAAIVIAILYTTSLRVSAADEPLATHPAPATREIPPTSYFLPTLTPNPLLANLLSGPAGGPFNVLDQTSTPAVIGPADQLDVSYAPNLPLTSLADHQYSMASHGLFIAGIIQSIAPKAKLRLIQVLNDGGGGSLESVAYGFSQALALAPTSPIVFPSYPP